MDYMNFVKNESIKFGMFNSPVRVSEDYIEIIYCGNMSDRVRRYFDFLNTEQEKGYLKYILERPISTNYAGRKFSWYKITIKINKENTDFLQNSEILE